MQCQPYWGKKVGKFLRNTKTSSKVPYFFYPEKFKISNFWGKNEGVSENSFFFFSRCCFFFPVPEIEWVNEWRVNFCWEKKNICTHSRVFPPKVANFKLFKVKKNMVPLRKTNQKNSRASRARKCRTFAGPRRERKGFLVEFDVRSHSYSTRHATLLYY